MKTNYVEISMKPVVCTADVDNFRQEKTFRVSYDPAISVNYISNARLSKKISRALIIHFVIWVSQQHC